MKGEMHKILFSRKKMFAYPAEIFQTCYPKHVFIWPYWRAAEVIGDISTATAMICQWTNCLHFPCSIHICQSNTVANVNTTWEEKMVIPVCQKECDQDQYFVEIPLETELKVILNISFYSLDYSALAWFDLPDMTCLCIPTTHLSPSLD